MTKLTNFRINPSWMMADICSHKVMAVSTRAGLDSNLTDYVKKECFNQRGKGWTAKEAHKRSLRPMLVDTAHLKRTH